MYFRIVWAILEEYVGRNVACACADRIYRSQSATGRALFANNLKHVFIWLNNDMAVKGHFNVNTTTT